MQKPGDDATVSVCKVRKPTFAHIMVGPPINKNDDNFVVEQLMNSPDKKAVCGGTTSQIVSRILGRELKVLTNYATPDVPPMGVIEGLDIVTEGVVTLNKVFEKITKYETGEICEIFTLKSKNDGSARLAHMMVEECTHINFYVGRAINPAHQNPDLPIGLNLKLRLVNDISEVLKRMGKIVSVEYY